MAVLGQTHTNRFQLHLHLRFLRQVQQREMAAIAEDAVQLRWQVQQMDVVQLSGAVQLRWQVQQMEMKASAENVVQFADLGCFTGVGRPANLSQMHD